MTNKYQIYTNLVLFFHTLALLFLLLSLPLVILYSAFRFVPVILVVLTLAQWWFLGSGCLFTKLENNLRRKYNPRTVYPEGCIVHYLRKWFGIKVTGFQAGAFLYVYFGLIIYFAIFKK